MPDSTPVQTPLTPAVHFEPEVLLRAQDVRVAFFDIDGVLTDGGVYFSGDGETLKRFNILDGLGLKLLREAGITPVVITGRDSAPLRVRLAALGVTHVHFGTERKLPVAEATLAQLGLDWRQAAAIGDDWPDLPVLRRAGFSAAPANAHAQVRASVHFVTQAEGGYGAAREFCDLLLVAGGHYARLLDALDAQPLHG
ncbi:MAG: 3-deoxy-D-manno-octulosonate 8-phosphate phosphatase [Lysobacteraceae bacterium]|nr:MAG: 3-deoxy-D-manno-octulosonate 8-phosphate phosphatase [Xanthomonadaceae bacterium]